MQIRVPSTLSFLCGLCGNFCDPHLNQSYEPIEFYYLMNRIVTYISKLFIILVQSWGWFTVIVSRALVSDELLKDSEKMNPQKRKFKRYPVEFHIRIDGKDAEGKIFNDTTSLINIAGGGALFASKFSENYFVGQLVQLTIHFPEAEHVSACLKGNAKLIRIDKKNAHRKNQTIAVVFENPLEFNISEQNTL